MGDVAKEGRTVLFVSHNMACIQRLCHSAILLDKGQIKAFRKVPDVIQTYLKEVVSPVSSWELSSAPMKNAYFKKIYLANEKEERLEHVTTASSLSVIMEYVVQRRCRNLQISVDLLDSNGDLYLHLIPKIAHWNHQTKLASIVRLCVCRLIFCYQKYMVSELISGPLGREFSIR